MPGDQGSFSVLEHVGEGARNLEFPESSGYADTTANPIWLDEETSFSSVSPDLLIVSGEEKDFILAYQSYLREGAVHEGGRVLREGDRLELMLGAAGIVFGVLALIWLARVVGNWALKKRGSRLGFPARAGTAARDVPTSTVGSRPREAAETRRASEDQQQRRPDPQPRAESTLYGPAYHDLSPPFWPVDPQARPQLPPYFSQDDPERDEQGSRPSAPHEGPGAERAGKPQSYAKAAGGVDKEVVRRPGKEDKEHSEQQEGEMEAPENLEDRQAEVEGGFCKKCERRHGEAEEGVKCDYWFCLLSGLSMHKVKAMDFDQRNRHLTSRSGSALPLSGFGAF